MTETLLLGHLVAISGKLWGAVGSGATALLGAWVGYRLSRSLQRTQWLADNKVQEWRELIATLTSSCRTIIEETVTIAERETPLAEQIALRELTAETEETVATLQADQDAPVGETIAALQKRRAEQERERKREREQEMKRKREQEMKRERVRKERAIGARQEAGLAAVEVLSSRIFIVEEMKRHEIAEKWYKAEGEAERSLDTTQFGKVFRELTEVIQKEAAQISI